MRAGAREIFTVNGFIGSVNGVKRFIPNSAPHTRQQMDSIPEGKRVSMTLSEWDVIRSDAQLAYHFVLVTYLAKHTGFTKDEMHDAVMRLKFGEKEVNIGGKTLMVRKSMSKSGKLKKHEVVELIEYDLELCADMDIHVPTAKELGYLPS